MNHEGKCELQERWWARLALEEPWEAQGAAVQAKQRISQARKPVVRPCDSVRFHETWDVLGTHTTWVTRSMKPRESSQTRQLHQGLLS